jgi:hypothetical protein
MKIHDLIVQNLAIIRILDKAHLLPARFGIRFKIFSYYMDCLSMGVSRRNAVRNTAKYFGCSDRTVYNAVAEFIKDV